MKLMSNLIQTKIKNQICSNTTYLANNIASRIELNNEGQIASILVHLNYAIAQHPA
jgi:hypothetical protein